MAAGASATEGLPAVAREFRGVWVATVSNIDWPSRPGLPAERQQAELTTILDRAVHLRLNAVILQVRPSADALYESALEPWSEFLTGQMGDPPQPFYDPLAFAIREAHGRGLELHAWFNPFRARTASGRPPAGNHLTRTHADAVRRYGNVLWLDPGDASVQDHVYRVVMDVTKRYDVDGIHFDDYFYPYKERDGFGSVLDFPDTETWNRYVRDGGTLARADWRRRNVDQFVQRVYAGIKERKPWVKFGISPFGIWRPGHPPEARGLDAYAELYADSRKWLTSGWVDYLAPQLYWQIGDPGQSYPQLLRWWVEQNARGRHIWPGGMLNRIGVGADGGWPATEVIDQIRLTRRISGATGNIHFSMHSLMENRGGLAERLRSAAYQAPALVPASPWLGREPPGPPAVQLRTDGRAGTLTVALRPAAGKQPFLWIVRTRKARRWSVQLVPATRREVELPGSAAPDLVAVSAVDRTGNEGAVTSVKVEGN